MKNSLVYLTRRCPQHCSYCALRDSGKDLGPELNAKGWIKAFDILHDIGVDFNLILGNECWLLGEDLIPIIQSTEIPYALYTTCPPELFNKYSVRFFEAGIDNLSCGVDYPLEYLNEQCGKGWKDDMEKKSFNAWMGLIWTRRFFPSVDTQATVTVHKQNFEWLPTLVRECYYHGIFLGVNFLHWNKDGEFDFFPEEGKLNNLMFENKDLIELKLVLNQVLEMKNTIQNVEMLTEDVEVLTRMGWYCGGNPYGGPTVDADGSLRLCGYRPGKRTPKYSIFDLTDKKKRVEWTAAMYLDSEKCPGCSWSYPWMFNYWLKEPMFGEKVFVKHAGKHIPTTNWSKRKVE